MFLLFSFLYLFSIFYSTVESFIPLNISFDNDGYLSSDTVLNVWRYHPYIEDFLHCKGLYITRHKKVSLGQSNYYLRKDFGIYQKFYLNLQSFLEAVPIEGKMIQYRNDTEK